MHSKNILHKYLSSRAKVRTSDCLSYCFVAGKRQDNQVSYRETCLFAVSEEQSFLSWQDMWLWGQECLHCIGAGAEVSKSQTNLDSVLLCLQPVDQMWTLRSSTRWQTFSNKTASPTSHQTMPPIRNLVFNCLRLWGHFSFKTLHYLNAHFYPQGLLKFLFLLDYCGNFKNSNDCPSMSLFLTFLIIKIK